MDLIGVLLGFAVILLLNSKKINMGLSLLAGSLVAGILSSLGLKQVLTTMAKTVIEPMTIQLVVIVVGISGLGYLMKQTGSLDQMIDSLIIIFKDGKILSMLLPVLIGTLAVPGGAILSAPMVDESGDRINLSKAHKTSVNLFFRHIGFLIYPLYASIIMTAKLFDIAKITIIKYNFLIMLAGLITSYFIFFRAENVDKTREKKKEVNKRQHVIDFFKGFSPILLVLFFSFVLNIPFHFSIFAGLLISFIRYLKNGHIRQRIRAFLFEGIDYNLAGLILGVMFFKAIVEASEAVNGVADFLLNMGIPLVLIIVVLGLISGYLTGVNLAALGILIPLFLPLFNMQNPGPYISLLFITTFLGYLVSPIHLCLVLTKEYFETGFRPVYRPLYLPMAAMITTGILQTVVFA